VNLLDSVYLWADVEKGMAKMKRMGFGATQRTMVKKAASQEVSESSIDVPLPKGEWGLTTQWPDATATLNPGRLHFENLGDFKGAVVLLHRGD